MHNTNPRVADAMQKIEEGLRSFLDSEKWKEHLRFQAQFHKYSWGNSLLIMMRKPSATYVAGYSRWRKMERYVKKGEKGIPILAPIIKKIEKEKNKEQEKSTEDPFIERLMGFKIVYVFDISQTDGKPLKITRLADILQGDSELYSHLLEICPFPICKENDLNGANGLFDDKSIFILDSLPEQQKAKTLVHEWAHGILHVNFGIQSFKRRQQAELEAESVAFAVCDALGMDTSDYTFGYLASWGEEEAIELFQKSVGRIQKTVHQILEKIEGTEHERKKENSEQKAV